MENLSPSWSGVFPASTTQFSETGDVDLDATQSVQAKLIDDGVDGLIILGTVGENNSLEPSEKLSVIRAAREAVGDKRPVLCGVSELTTARAVKFVKDAEEAGVSGLMVLPAMVYVPKEEELSAHFKTVAEATGLPIMLYNNPSAYRTTIGLEVLKELSKVPNIVAIKESAPDSRRFTDVINAIGDDLILFAGLDDVALEGLLLGARGWVSGLTNAFPNESVALVAAVKAGDLEGAREIYRWFMPLLHLDAVHDLVQSIKLAEEIMGRGSERVRMPRMVLSGERRQEVVQMVEAAAASRPTEIVARYT
ncbi:MAG: dihydrodipicolinate synthase family protein [Pseudomonadota bacterium]